MTFNTLLKNKNVLYVVSFLALTNIFSYLINNNVDAVILFILIGYVTTYFSKNMILVLLVPMLTTNFLLALRTMGNNVREGLENNEPNVTVTKSQDNEVVNNKKVNESENVTAGDEPSKQSQVNYSKTLEQAYDNLDKIIGTDGISKMSEETTRLAEQQQKLMKNIENMAPLLKNATKMLEGLPLDSISTIQESISNVMGKMKK
jgi:hypothetical protein